MTQSEKIEILEKAVRVMAGHLINISKTLSNSGSMGNKFDEQFRNEIYPILENLDKEKK